MNHFAHEISESQFETEVLNSSLPVLVDFWGELCGLCRVISPIVEEVAQTYHKKIKIVKINVNEFPDIAAKYSIRGIPALLLFKEGNLVGTKYGALSKQTLIDFIHT